MKINRQDLLKILKVSSLGLTSTEVLDQSHCFVFTGGELVTFNDEILVRVPSPLEDLEAVVLAADFMNVLARLPDEEVEVKMKKDEVLIKGRRRSAGITSLKDVLLPFSEIARPKKWRKMKEGVQDALTQAARTCGRDASNPMTTVVHITKEGVEACDNFRLFRSEIETGIGECLVPASSILNLESATLSKVSLGEGWLHFLSSKGHELSCRCSHGEYADLAPILKMKKGETIALPEDLAEIVGRAEVMSLQEGLSTVSISIEEGTLEATSRKDGGWFKEKKKIKYKGPTLKFDVHPRFLLDMLERTHEVEIDGNSGKMKMSDDDVQFVVCLEV